MGLSKETLGPETRMTFFPVSLRSSETKVNNPPIAETSRLRARIDELIQMLSAESKKEKKTGEQPQKKTPRKDGFEPFVNPESTQPEDALFVNGYNGIYAQQMDLNRKGVERVLKIAHLNGKVVLTQLIPSRQRSIEANPDGSVSAKRFLFFGEKIEKDGKENPLHRVVSTPQGWRIEINDTKIREGLEGKKLSGEKLKTRFIEKFNRQLKQGIWKCVLREKLTGEKDKLFKKKLILSLFYPTYASLVFATHLIPPDHAYIITAIGLAGLHYLFVNVSLNFIPLFKVQGHRNIDHKWEYLMPQLEIDKVARSGISLALKGRTLVKEAKQPENK